MDSIKKRLEAELKESSRQDTSRAEPAQETRPLFKALNALRVIALTDQIANRLKRHDPQGLKQVCEAIQSIEASDEYANR